MKLKDSFHPYALVTIIFWSLAYVFTRLALKYFTPLSLGFLRYFAAACTLLVIAVFTKMKLPHRCDWPWFLVSGLVGFTFYVIAFNKGEGTVTAATASVVIAAVPVITALLARFVYNEKLQGYKWAAIGIEFTGVIVLTLMDSEFSINVGLIWLLSAALALSTYNLIQRRLTKSYSALQTSAYSIFFGTIMLAVFLPSSVSEASKAPFIQLIYVAVLGVFSSAAAYVSWAKAFSKAKQTSQVSNYMFITPFLTCILGVLLAGEVPDRATVVGGAIIIFGMFVFNFGSKVYEIIVKKKSILSR